MSGISQWECYSSYALQSVLIIVLRGFFFNTQSYMLNTPKFNYFLSEFKTSINFRQIERRLNSNQYKQRMSDECNIGILQIGFIRVIKIKKLILNAIIIKENLYADAAAIETFRFEKNRLHLANSARSYFVSRAVIYQNALSPTQRLPAVTGPLQTDSRTDCSSVHTSYTQCVCVSVSVIICIIHRR